MHIRVNRDDVNSQSWNGDIMLIQTIVDVHLWPHSKDLGINTSAEF